MDDIQKVVENIEGVIIEHYQELSMSGDKEIAQAGRFGLELAPSFLRMIAAERGRNFDSSTAMYNVILIFSRFASGFIKSAFSSKDYGTLAAMTGSLFEYLIADRLLGEGDEGVKRNVIVFDIDGTLANIDHRLGFISGEKKDWTSFFEAMKDDIAIKPMVDILLKFTASIGSVVVVATGRPEKYREMTSTWLKTSCIPVGTIYMRKDEDFRPDHVVKEEMLKTITAEFGKPSLVFEDRANVVEMWRSHGILTCQVG